MNSKQIENKAWFKAREDIELICKPILSQTPLENIVYQKIYKDGSRTILSTHTELVLEQFVKPEAKVKNLYTPSIRHGDRYYYTASWAETIQNSTAAQVLKQAIRYEGEVFGLFHEFDLVEHKDQYEESLTFFASDKSIGMENFYINNINVLEQFRLYFLDKAHDLINKVDKERVVEPWREVDSNIIYFDRPNNQSVILDAPMGSEPAKLDFVPTIPKKFYFQVNNVEEYLTKREFECAIQLIQGKNNVDMAKNLFVSPRTIETHLESLRAKTGRGNRQHLIDFFISHGLSKLF